MNKKTKSQKKNPFGGIDASYKKQIKNGYDKGIALLKKGGLVLKEGAEEIAPKTYPKCALRGQRGIKNPETGEFLKFPEPPIVLHPNRGHSKYCPICAS